MSSRPQASGLSEEDVWKEWTQAWLETEVFTADAAATVRSLAADKLKLLLRPERKMVKLT